MGGVKVICLVTVSQDTMPNTDDVQAAHRHALSVGAIEMHIPESKPWGQTMSIVRCPNGILVELCSPVSR